MSLFVVPDRPDNRHPRRATPATYRLRIDIDDAQPAIWRTLDVRSDVSLAELHLIVQAAYAWLDCHLFRFSLGAPFARTSQLFLCPFDAAEGDPMTRGLPVADVTLDEVLTSPGDVLDYVYDYGDSWQLTIRLDEIAPLDGDRPPAVLVGGDRAAPPEDCGHRVTAADLAEILDDPAHFDPAVVERALRDAAVRAEPTKFGGLIDRLSSSGLATVVGEQWQLAKSLPLDDPADGALVAALHPFLWFLDRAAGDGIPLTSAGFLVPDVVSTAADIVPGGRDWIGKRNRETQTQPVWDFRVLLQEVKLLRKFKGKLVLTAAGKKVASKPAALWKFLREQLLENTTTGNYEASTLIALFVATSEGQYVDYSGPAAAVAALGWRSERGTTLSSVDTGHFRAARILACVGDVATHSDRGDYRKVSPAAALLARQALSDA